MEINDYYLSKSKPLIEMAVREDVGSGDITTDSLIGKEVTCSGKIIAKESGILAGIIVFNSVFNFIDGSGLKLNSELVDKAVLTKGDLIAEFSGSYRTILTGERTALNFLQRMCGVATKTNEFVKILNGTGVSLSDTRKTIPGFRYLDKYSVLIGGGVNHRFGLFDMVLIKENHIKIAGSIENAVQFVRKRHGSRFKIEIETQNIADVQEALKTKPDMILLDNMEISEMCEAVKLTNHRSKIEASGNITLENLSSIASTGVDFISVGAITHSAKSLDISLLII
ncbi:MAG: carboxylating nicotinate-nucleotide diphosphorylase [Bacteroidetes bacterium]|nr:carboxylating nicotinate-nucleotide diphosphorylase [Bacteroidota bacterium]MBU1679419.1 carboxylating nicotinate-nucleotide diphosphorylase [Bacteroidota bacterium]MBU2506809.1 carboxylating nicotinate-nucleotide diphosphorylase [Bacteroidota bacterium]